MTGKTVVYKKKEIVSGETAGKIPWKYLTILLVGIMVVGILWFAATALSTTQHSQQTAQGFAFVAVGPPHIIPANAHEKIVSVKADERYAVTLDATAAGIKGLNFKEWNFGYGTNPSPKTGFCIPSDYYKSGEEMKIKAIAVDGQGKTVEDEIKIIFR